MALNNASIARKANKVLLFATVAILSITAVVYSSFSFFSQQIEHSRKNTIPSLIHLTNLAQQGQWLQVQMEQSLSTNNPLIQRGIAENIKKNNSYKAPLKALKTLGKGPLFLEKLEAEFVRLRKQILTTLTVKNRILSLQEKNDYILTRLTIILQRISKNKDGKKDPIDDLTIQVIGKFFTMQASKDQRLVAILGRECAFLFTQGDELLTPENDTTMKSASRLAYLELKRVFFKVNGFWANKKNELSLYSTFVQRKSQSVFTATTIVQRCNELLTQGGVDLQNRQENIATQFSLIKLTTFSFLFFILLCFFSMYAFLHRRILRPIGQLSRAIGQRTKEVRAGEKAISALPLIGDREIKEISESTIYFIREIESQREALANSHAHLEQQVQRRTEHIADLSTKIITIQEEEGKRIAAELHDDIGATMSVVKLGIEHVSRLLARENINNDQLQISLQKQKQLVQHVTARLRVIQENLSPPYLDLGFIEALEVLCEDYTMLHETMSFAHSFRLTEKQIPHDLHLVMYRIIQEGLTNIVKHSHATKAEISLCSQDNAIVLRIKDNGIQFPDTSKTTGRGLKNIEGRALISHGIVEYIQEEEWKYIQIYWPSNPDKI